MVPVDILGNWNFFFLYQQLILSEGYLLLVFRKAATAKSAAKAMTAFGVQIVSFELFKTLFLSLFELEVNKC